MGIRLLLVLAIAMSGCGGGNGAADAGGTTDGSGGANDLSGAVDGAGNGDAGTPADAATGLGDASGVVDNIPLTGQPVSLAIDPPRNRLYAGVADPLNAGNLGIAVIDTRTDTVEMTVAPPPPKMGVKQYPFYLLAIDAMANVIYAASSIQSATVYVFDAAGDQFKPSFDVVGQALTEACSQITDLAVDPAKSRLYISCQGDAGDVEIVVVDTTKVTPVKSIVLKDLASPFGRIALDTKNNLLFVSNGQQLASPILVDTIDTVNQVQMNGQQKLPAGSLVGQLGGAGFAVLATSLKTDGGTSGRFYSLEPSNVELPAGFVPDSFLAVSLDGTNFEVFGHDEASQATEHVHLTLSGMEGDPIMVSEVGKVGGHTPGFDITNARAQNESEIFVYEVEHLKGGGTNPPKSIYHLHITN